jgi:CRP/FNR family transcriptional regulator, cyclic AMP receptor protein
MEGRSHPAFASGLTEAEAVALRERAIQRKYEQGASIFHEGDDAGQALLLTAGRVKVTMLTRGGREVVLGFAGPGDLIGELSALVGRRTATLSALERVAALAIPAAEFRGFLERHPRVMRLMLTSALERLQEANRLQLEFAAQDTLGRVASRLVELCNRFGEQDDEGIVITLPISQEELAGWSGSSREAVAKALQTLRNLGAIETDRRRITVVEPETLATYAL